MTRESDSAAGAVFLCRPSDGADRRYFPLNSQKRIAVINDLSGFGRCSLTVALPLLSALGCQACPLPTAILSNHTGYPGYYFEDFTDRMERYYSQWKALRLTFDAIYTGFLGSAAQAEVVGRFIDDFRPARGGTVLVDPAFGDDGRLYSTCDAALVAGMKRLCRGADFITPNLTEAAMLAGVPYERGLRQAGQFPERSAAAGLARRLTELCPGVILTGLHRGEEIGALLCRRDGPVYAAFVPRVDADYAGTGDVFASVLCGCLARGQTPEEAMQRAAAFTSRAVALSSKMGVPSQDGVAFELCIPWLLR